LAADENFDARIIAGLTARSPELNVVTIGHAGLRGAADSVVLEWAARENRVLLTHDERTMPAFAFARMDAQQPMPGVILVADRMPLGTAVEQLTLIALAMSPEEMESRGVVRLPL
jgi:predicted nuclease of predicted toxin-antitoxin system